MRCDMLCSYGCGSEAVVVFEKGKAKGKACCSREARLCPGFRAFHKQAFRQRTQTKCIEGKGLPCAHGCGQPGVFFVQYTRSWICSPSGNQCPAVKERQEGAMIEAFGAKNIMQTEEGKERLRSSLQSRFGVDHIAHIPGVQEKIVGTSMERYGVPSPNQYAPKKEKTRVTNQERYGGPCSMCSPVTRAKAKQTFFRRYGVEHALQHLEFFEKQMKTSYTSKDVTLPSGRVVRMQGYEPQVFRELLCMGLKEEDFEFDLAQWPVITYLDAKGDTRRYTPDFFVPRLNWFIEVKSTRTFKLDTGRILRKRSAVRAAGFMFNLIVRDYTKSSRRLPALP